MFRWAAHGSALRDAPAQRSRAARSHDDERLFRAAGKSADAWFDLRECCNEDAAARVDARASTATCSARYIGVTCFRKSSGRERSPAWRTPGTQCRLLSAAGVEQAAHAVLGRRAYRVERAATHRLRLLLAVVGAGGALNERGGPAIRREERRRAAARGERARHRDDDRKRRAANPMHDARRGCLTAFHGKPRWPLVFGRTRLCHGRLALRLSCYGVFGFGSVTGPVTGSVIGCVSGSASVL